MKVHILRAGKEHIVHATKAQIRVLPFGTLIVIDKAHYPLMQGQTAWITDDDEPAEILVGSPKGPRNKFKQGKLDLK